MKNKRVKAERRPRIDVVEDWVTRYYKQACTALDNEMAKPLDTRNAMRVEVLRERCHTMGTVSFMVRAINEGGFTPKSLTRRTRS